MLPRLEFTAQGGNNELPRAVGLEDDILYRYCKVLLDFYELEMPLGLIEQERDMLPGRDLHTDGVLNV